MKCPKCDHENKKRKFCSKCGSKLENVCPKCGYKNDPEDDFCGECGEKLVNATPAIAQDIPRLEDMKDKLYVPEPLRKRMDTAKQELQGENRLVTALFADISGFSKFSNQYSSEKVVSIVNDCFKVIIDVTFEYEGDPNRFIGDNVLAFFGAPIAHENDPERAIMAGLEIREKVRELSLEVSIGINTGMMYFGHIGTREHHEISAYGPDINLAKRLQEYAEPGQILVGNGTYRFTRRAFDFDVLKSLNLKGFDQPITAYSVQQRKLHPEKIRGIEGLRARMIGREHEFSEAKEAVDGWLNGHGQMVSIIGEAGIGKSRLVAEMIKDLRLKIKDSEDNNSQSSIFNLQSLILEGRCVSIGQPISYWPFLDILRTYFQLSEGDNPATIASKVIEGIKNIFPASAEEILPFLGHLLSIKFGNELDDWLKFATPEQIRHQTLMQLRDLFRTLAEKQPLLLILEDLHWADDLSLDLISLLMDELAHTPLMLLCVYRPDKEHRVRQLSDQANRKCLDRYTEIVLKPLTSFESRQLVEELLAIENLPENVRDIILQKSEGNPFFIEEVIRSLMEQDAIYREEDHWKARMEITNINVPDTIQSVVLSRVDRLQAEAKYVLQCASVIGRLFRYRLLEHLNQQERNLYGYLGDLEGRDLIHEERTVPELEYAFKHAFTQEATYQGILEQKRKEFHLQIAQGIERLYQERLEEYYEELAHHYSMSQDAEKAVEYLLKAGDRAKLNYDNDTAISHFRRVIDILDSHNIDRQEWRLDALRGLGEVYLGTGKVAEALDSFEKSVKIGEDIGLELHLLVRIYSWLCSSLSWLFRLDDPIMYANKGLELLKDDPECLEAVLMYTHLGLANRGISNEFAKCANKIMESIKNIPYSIELGDSYQLIVEFFIYSERSPQLAWEWVKEMENRALRHHDLITVSLAKLEQVSIMVCQGDYQNAYRIAREIPDIIKRTGDEKYGQWCCGVTAIIMLILGNLEEAEKNAKISADLSERITAPGNIVGSYAILGRISLARYRIDEAISYYEKAVKTIKTMMGGLFLPDPMFWWFPDPRFELGKSYLRNGEIEKSIQIFNEFADLVFSEPYNWYRQHQISWLLEGVESIYRDSRDKLINFCDSFKQRYVNNVNGFSLQQWYLEPAQISQYDQLSYTEDFYDSLDPSWTWIDRFGDCHYRLSENDGIEIHSANGRDLYWNNLSAPRFVRQVSGDFAVEVCISPVSNEKPQLGGLYISSDNWNHICFEKGRSDPYGLWFYRNVYPQIAGRGFLPDKADQVYLRIERIGDEFSAYCSIDGNNWLTCGKLELAMGDNISVGIYAHGMIDRTIYCGEYREGTATLFRNFKIWTR